MYGLHGLCEPHDSVWNNSFKIKHRLFNLLSDPFPTYFYKTSFKKRLQQTLSFLQSFLFHLSNVSFALIVLIIPLFLNTAIAYEEIFNLYSSKHPLQTVVESMYLSFYGLN